MGYIPEDIVTKILVLVPAKSLIRFKSVCMAWLSIITNPDFIKYHLSLAKKNPRLLIVRKVPSVAPSGIISCDEHFDRVVLPSLFYPDHRVVGCCNGIICLATICGDAVYFWNPLTMQFKKLTLTLLGTSYTQTSKRKRRSYRHIIQFGHDSVSDDYKVFRFLGKKEWSNFVPVLQVYSTNARCWREFSDPTLTILDWHRKTSVVNNVLCFFCDNKNLVTFDFHEEVFRLVQLPNFNEIWWWACPIDFQGSVALVIKSSGDGGPGKDLWTLDDVSGQMFWTKKFSIDDSDGFTDICCYVGAGQFHGIKSLKKSRHSYLEVDILYDYEKNKTIYCGLSEDKEDILYDYEKGETINRDLTHHWGVCATEKYIQTLVSMDGFQQVPF